ncbi:DUF4444 domain-containing protein [Psychromarinibacter sp. S121]|uniref:biotin/lipoate--protein ligase family protein n=1 Tax=Psychromarinibacter sp. S121 TaxID=3415127 RepID=UPI003C7B36D2
MSDLSFPPLFTGEAVTGDPFTAARARAAEGCDAGLITYRPAPDRLEAAIVFAPEVPLADAVLALPVCGIGFQNALGALAPPSVGVYLDWDGGIRVNGGLCGRLRMAAETADPDTVPGWLVIGLDLTVLDATEDPGETPDTTALYNEGCGDIELPQLLEAWARHTLVWLGRWEDEGAGPVHREWTGIAHGIEEQVTQDGVTGTFTGVDERLGMLLKTGGTTRLIPLTELLEDPA